MHSYFQSIPRLSSILSDTPIHIQTLTLREIQEIIKKRFDTLRISNDLNYVIPYSEDGLRALFDLFGGNIRNILNSLSTAIMEITREKPVMLDEKTLAVTLKAVVEKRYFSMLQPRARQVLQAVVGHEEITNKQLSIKTKIAQPNISTYISNLVSGGCVYLRRKSGKDKFWSADPKIKWSLLKEAEKSQKKIHEFD